MLMNVLITGGNGFIGSNLTSKLSEKGIQATSLSRSKGHDLLDLKPGVTKDYDYIIHLAANLDVRSSLDSPKSFIHENLDMTLNLLEDMREFNTSAKFIFLSSERVYGSTTDEPLKETSICKPIDPYGCSKLLCEHALETYANLYDIEYVTLRPSIVFGPMQEGNLFIPSIMRKALSGQKEIEVGKLHMKRNFVHVDDVTDVLMDMLHKPFKSGEIYNIASYYHTMATVADKITGMTGVKIIQTTKHARPSKVEMNGSAMDTSKLTRDYGWSVKRSFDEAMETLL